MAKKSAVLTDELLGLIGRRIDPATKATLSRHGFLVGAKVDSFAVGALGVSYDAARIAIGGKRVVGVGGVAFYAAKQRLFFRDAAGKLAPVTFAAYAAALPHGVAFGDKRAAVAKKLGAPTDSYDDEDWWDDAAAQRRTSCTFGAGALVRVAVQHRP